MTDSSPQTPASIGEQLRQIRESKKLSLDQIAYQTHIRLRYLSALETDEFSVFPSMAQGRGFLRAYASYLGLNADHLIVTLDGKALPVVSTPAPSATTSETDASSSQSDETSDIPKNDSEPVVAGDASFIVVGQKLRSQRQLLGLSIEDVERHSHIRLHYLEALEAGRIDDLPSPVQGRGMLTNYATFLGLDPDPLLLRYAEGLQARLVFRQRLARPVKPIRRAIDDPTVPRRRLPFDLIIGGVLALGLIAFLVWGAARISQMVGQVTPEATGPSIANVLAGEGTPVGEGMPAGEGTPVGENATTATLVNPSGSVSQTLTTNETAATPTLLSPVENLAVTSTPDVPVPTPNNAPVQVYIVAVGSAWLQVTVDGKVEFEGRTLAGSNYPYAGNENVTIKTGNGAAIKVLYNQNDLGVLGGFGEVAERIFTVSGVQLPTPTVTDTPPPATATPAVTPTSTPTP
jgi:cytoskeletal protein RodZ